MKYRGLTGLVAAIGLGLAGGCYAPLCSPGVPAPELPEIYRMPQRSVAMPLNFSHLAVSPPVDYLLGPGDALDIMVLPGEGAAAAAQPTVLRVQVLGDGTVHLPLVGGVRVGGMPLPQARQAIYEAYNSPDIYKNPTVSVVLAEKSMVNVVVLGAVDQPGVYPLPKYENDVAHALAAARGLTEEAGKVIEVHRRSRIHALPEIPAPLPLPVPGAVPGRRPPREQDQSPAADEDRPLEHPAGESPNDAVDPVGHTVESVGDASGIGWTPLSAAARQAVVPAQYESGLPTSPVPEIVDGILRIPLLGAAPGQLGVHDVVLQPGDVVVVPRKKHDVFYVVGPVAPLNFIRFTVGMEEREIGGGFLIPPNRDIDVVTAVAMAGYIDPIDSPTTVTVHRMEPDGNQLLINVDLIKARYSWQENLYVQPGDILYLNPDPWWWFRRTFDRVLPDLITIPYQNQIIGPGRFRNNR